MRRRRLKSNVTFIFQKVNLSIFYAIREQPKRECEEQVSIIFTNNVLEMVTKHTTKVTERNTLQVSCKLQKIYLFIYFSCCKIIPSTRKEQPTAEL